MHHDSLQRCTDLCNRCSAVCTETSIHCLGMGGEHASPQHQTLLQDCSDICAVAARFMARQSQHHGHVCRECAEICQQCAAECEMMADGDDQMKECAQMCRRCASECGRMAAMYA